ncbi:MAG: hypothetical protein ACPGQM_09810 [Alphaproteobacteria bacterium]
MTTGSSTKPIPTEAPTTRCFRAKVEEVVALRHNLPLGGALKEG